MTFKVDTLPEIVLKAAENGFDDFDIQGMLTDFREEHGRRFTTTEICKRIGKMAEVEGGI